MPWFRRRGPQLNAGSPLTTELSGMHLIALSRERLTRTKDGLRQQGSASRDCFTARLKSCPDTNLIAMINRRTFSTRGKVRAERRFRRGLSPLTARDSFTAPFDSAPSPPHRAKTG